MMKQALFSSLLCLSLLLSAGKALALDIPPGGDALGNQLVASQSAVIAQLTFNDSTAMSFVASVPLTGQTPSTQFRLVHDSYTEGAQLTVGGYYLLFLTRDAAGGLELATSVHSIVSASPAQAESYRLAIGNYQQTQADPQAFKRVALSLVDSSVPYLRYSAVADLARRGLFTADDGPVLSRLATVTSTAPAHPEVRKLALRQLGSLQLRSYADQLGSVLGNPSEPTSVRMAALEGLSFMGATEVILRQAASVGQSKSPKLKQRMMEAVGAL